jgi:photosystem II stability/assembly factor-like uncharacterized protein
MSRSAGPPMPRLLGPIVIAVVTASFRFSSIESPEPATDAALNWSVLHDKPSTPRGPNGLGVQLRGIAAQGATLMAAAPNQSLRSDDGGATWRDIGSLRSAFDVLIRDSLVLLGTTGGTMHRSTDGGRTFSLVKLNVSSGIPATAFSGDTLFAIGNRVMVRSTDLAATWASVPLPEVTLTEIATRNRVVLIVGGAGFIRRSTDRGATWTDRWIDTYSQLTGVAFVDDSTAVIVGSGGAVFRSPDGGSTWSAVASPAAATLRSVAFIGTHGLAVGNWGEAIHTADGGLTWTRERTGTNAFLQRVTATDDGFVVVGYFETILRARIP